jgi:hypothetical protein
MSRGSKPGERRGGRQKGTPNKMTQDAKEAIEFVAQGLGGAEGMLAWAKKDATNERIFWSNIYPRILPKEIKAEVDAQLVVNVHRGNRPAE